MMSSELSRQLVHVDFPPAPPAVTTRLNRALILQKLGAAAGASAGAPCRWGGAVAAGGVGGSPSSNSAKTIPAARSSAERAPLPRPSLLKTSCAFAYASTVPGVHGAAFLAAGAPLRLRTLPSGSMSTSSCPAPVASSAPPAADAPAAVGDAVTALPSPSPSSPSSPSTSPSQMSLTCSSKSGSSAKTNSLLALASASCTSSAKGLTASTNAFLFSASAMKLRRLAIATTSLNTLEPSASSTPSTAARRRRRRW